MVKRELGAGSIHNKNHPFIHLNYIHFVDSKVIRLSFILNWLIRLIKLNYLYIYLHKQIELRPFPENMMM